MQEEKPVTDATAIPVNLFQNDRELMVVAPMPGVSPENISIDVTDDGRLTLRSSMHGEGQERIEYLRGSGRTGRMSGRSTCRAPSMRVGPT